MRSSDLRVITDTVIWNRFLERSPQGTKFLSPSFLDLFDVPYRLYGYFKKEVLTVGVPIIDTSKLNREFLPQCYYQGPIFSGEIYRSGASKKIQYEIELVDEFLSELVAVERQFNFSLSPTLRDVRGFSWFNYHESEKPKCLISPKYSAVVNLEGRGSIDYRLASRSARRQEERYAKEREGLRTDTGCVNDLIKCYVNTFRKQGVEVDDGEIDFLRRYSNFFLSEGSGFVLVIRNTNGEVVASALLFEDYHQTWHVPLLGVGETRYGGTLLYFWLLDYASLKGGAKLDFNGANSPNRGYFKHSIGAYPELYFEVSYRE